MGPSLISSRNDNVVTKVVLRAPGPGFVRNTKGFTSAEEEITAGFLGFTLGQLE
jgi:hypothetical protein